jgi:hypothetical protein
MMGMTTRQYQALQAEGCRLLQELPRGQLLDGLAAVYTAGRLLHVTRPTLIGLLGSVVLQRILPEVDEEAPPAAPEAGLWPRVITRAGYDEAGNLLLVGSDDNERMWCETLSGRSQEGWLLKQLYVERRFGRRKARRAGRRVRRE